MTAFLDKLKNIVDIGVSHGIINQKQADFICISHPTIVVFHSFPEIHKGDFAPAFCPTVKGIGSINENLCAWLASFTGLPA